MTKKKPRESRLWQFDPSMFEPGPKAGFLERHLYNRGRSLAKFSLYALAFAYPLILVSLGIIFGGLVFWTGFAGSVGIIWLVIKKAGYSANFAGWDIGFAKFVGLAGAFGISLAFFYGLIYVKIWVAPIFIGVLAVVLIIGVMRKSDQ